MTSDEHERLLKRESDAAWRKAADLAMARSVDCDNDAFSRGLAALQAEDDPEFITSVAAAALCMLDEMFKPWPIERRRHVLMQVIERFSTDLDPSDLDDLEPPRGSS